MDITQIRIERLEESERRTLQELSGVRVEQLRLNDMLQMALNHNHALQKQLSELKKKVAESAIESAIRVVV